MISILGALIIVKFKSRKSKFTPIIEEEIEEPVRNSPCTEDEDYNEDFGRLHGNLATQMYETCDKWKNISLIRIILNWNEH